MEAVEMRLAEGFQPTRTTYLAFGHDEEVMGPEGAQHIVKVLRERGVTELALVLDEGLPVTAGLFPGVSNPIALIGTTEKGYLTLELKVAGPGGALGDAAGELQHRDPRPGDHEGRGEPVPVPGDAGCARPDALPRVGPA
jgi:acetylornithine deacetylase/succinyl-diaminopimelate desuccinylase-like protein